MSEEAAWRRAIQRRLNELTWRADSIDKIVIPADTWTEIVKVDGTRMIVKPVSYTHLTLPTTPYV